jgi:predicted membrane protein
MIDELKIIWVCVAILFLLFLLKRKWSREEQQRVEKLVEKAAKKPPTREEIFKKKAIEQIEKYPDLSRQLEDLNHGILVGNAGDVCREIALTVVYERAINNQLEERISKLERNFKRG